MKPDENFASPARVKHISKTVIDRGKHVGIKIIDTCTLYNFRIDNFLIALKKKKLSPKK